MRPGQPRAAFVVMRSLSSSTDLSLTLQAPLLATGLSAEHELPRRLRRRAALDKLLEVGCACRNLNRASHILTDCPLQADLAPGAVAALETLAQDFMGKTLEVGCAVARRRRSDTLAPADLAVGLERLWCGSHCTFRYHIKQCCETLKRFCIGAGHRRSDPLAPANLAVGLERLWWVCWQLAPALI